MSAERYGIAIGNFLQILEVVGDFVRSVTNVVRKISELSSDAVKNNYRMRRYDEKTEHKFGHTIFLNLKITNHCRFIRMVQKDSL